ncbi:MAG: hypothetical protein EBX41_08125 [Chitinophagia bacterium]|nr:hypothetical protein [Chitinophagia bacterium]
MPAPSFDLIDVIKTVQKKFRIIIAITLACMVIAGVLFAVKKKKYKATARFFVTNPLYADRSSLFRNIEQKYVDYFGGDDDLDKVVVLLSTDTVKDRIIRQCDFDKIYKSDINDPKGHAYLISIFTKNFNVKRSEYKDIEVSYTTYEPTAAATIANTTVKVTEEIYRAYYTEMKNNMYSAINSKLHELDTQIVRYTDSLASLREMYGIYSIINPARANIMIGDTKIAGKGMGKAIELIQNIEAVKDQLVADRAKYYSLLYEFSATTHEEMRFLKVTTRAVPPTEPAGLSLPMMVIIAAFLGVFFSTLLMLLLEYYKKLDAVVR